MSWIDGRHPPVPDAFRSHLTDTAAESGSLGALKRAAARALSETLARPGRDREAAFHLLTADAYATYACEAAAEGEAVLEGLRDILEGVQEDGS